VGPIVQTERIVLAVAADHPLADRDSVSYEDLSDHRVLSSTAPDYWWPPSRHSTPQRAAIVRARTWPTSRSSSRSSLPATRSARCTTTPAGTTRPRHPLPPVADATDRQLGADLARTRETDLVRTFPRSSQIMGRPAVGTALSASIGTVRSRTRQVCGVRSWAVEECLTTALSARRRVQNSATLRCAVAESMVRMVSPSVLVVCSEAVDDAYTEGARTSATRVAGWSVR